MLTSVAIKECLVKVLVAVKRVPDYQSVIRIKSDGSGVETANLKMSMNPFDEIAVEAAVQLKEQGKVTEIVVVSMGNDSAQETLRAALAMGADRAILMKTDAVVWPLQAANCLKTLVTEENPSLVILGKQAIDTDNNQVGQMLAGLLNWPQATFASKLACRDDGISVTREMDGGLETLLLKLPAVITTDLRLNEPRYLSLPNIMKAKSKPLTVRDAVLSGTSKLNCLSLALPPKRRAGVKLESVDELVKRLKEEARVIS
jgi:electron transfer flavoprotein beta subunit